MVRDTYALSAVATATGLARDSLRFSEDEDDSLISGPDRRHWEVNPPQFSGLAMPEPPRGWIVAPRRRDSVTAPVWVAELPNDHWLRLADEGALATLFAALPDLPPETLAHLVAIILPPDGAEYIIATEDAIGLHLQERAADIPQIDRPLTFTAGPSGSWELGFLSIKQHRAIAGQPVTAARWSVRFAPAAGLRWERHELLSDVLLERYRLN